MALGVDYQGRKKSETSERWGKQVEKRYVKSKREINNNYTPRNIPVT